MRQQRPSNKLFLLILFACGMTGFRADAQIPARLYDLRCEHLVGPIGTDAAQPRLSWKISSGAANFRQRAFQIFIHTDSNAIKQGHSLFDLPRENSDSQLFILRQAGLEPFTRYYWRVMIWDGKGEQISSGIRYFETGFLSRAAWQGSWISDSRSIDKKEAPYFRTTFSAGKEVISARAYIAAAGLYELYFNGARAGSHRLDPMYTRYDRRNLYVTYDVTGLIHPGKNCIGVLLGNGWYNHQSTAVWYFDKAPWRARPAFCMDVRITYADGSTEIISTGKNWKTAPSPVIFNSIYTAEHYDARKELPGWNTADYNDDGWKAVIFRSAPSDNITAQTTVPIRDVDTINPVSMSKIDDTTYVFDLGRNISGVSGITLDAPEGRIFRIKHSERLYKDGRADQSNIDVHYRPTDGSDPFQTDIWITDGKGPETFKPRFNYKGFQYVEVTSSVPFHLKPTDLKAYFMHSDVERKGSISSSNPTLDLIWRATNNSYLSNLFGYPTDCPQREKNGWTGDAHIAVETGLYNFDGITVYEKWLADHRDEQQPNGVLPSIIPSNGWGYEWGNGPDWTSTIILIPWNIYLFYGDSKILSDNYENMKKYVDHIASVSPEYLTNWGLGDWVPVRSKAPVELTSSCYYYADAYLLSRISRILGHDADAGRYGHLAEQIKTAINNKYLNTHTGIYGNGLQTELSVPLFWGVAPDHLKTKIADNLAARVKADGDHIDVGLLGTKAILNALSDHGHAETAYTLAAQETFPSWGWWIKNGATTLYENWPIDATSDISMNHIMFGEISAWMYKAPGGIKPDPEQPGFKNIILEPRFVKGLEYFNASHNGPYGTITSSWTRKRGSIFYRITIPPNSSATVKLPGNYKIFLKGIQQTDHIMQVDPGKYEFELR